MTSDRRRLRAGLFRIPEESPATLREIALEYTRECPRDAAGWAFLATALIELRLYTKARTALRRLDRVAPGRLAYPVCVRWAAYYDAIGDLKRSEGWYRRAVAAAPAALVFLGALLAKQGRLAEAKRCHRRATRLPDDVRLARDEAYFNLGLILRAERRYRTALDCFDRAIALNPKYVEAFEARADVRSALIVVAPEEERTHWRRMLDEWGTNPATGHELVREYTRRYPSQSGGWVVLADILAGFARYADAAAALRRAQHVARWEEWSEPPDHWFAVQWGFLYQQKEDFRRAESSLRRAVALRPSGRNLTHLAEVLVVQGQLAAAKRYLMRAVRKNSGDLSIAHYHLGLIARSNREFGSALRSLDEALRLDPTYSLAREARRDVQRAMKATEARR